MTINFYHGGGAGDLLYGMCAVKAICEKQGGKAVLYTNIGNPLFQDLKPLLVNQAYIEDVVQLSSKADTPTPYIDLDVFRDCPDIAHVHLTEAHLKMLNVEPDWDWKNEGWFKVEVNNEPLLFSCQNTHLINRTPRYPENKAESKMDYDKYVKELWGDYNTTPVMFMGYPYEFAKFVNELSIEASNRLELLPYKYMNYYQNAIAMCFAKSFTGNQSSLLALAEGLGIDYRIERAPHHTNCNLYVSRETTINVIGDGLDR